jgi:hypothetical protein
VPDALIPYIGYDPVRPKVLYVSGSTIPHGIYQNSPITITSTSVADSNVKVSRNIILDVSAIDPSNLEIYGDTNPTGSSSSGRIVYSGVLNNGNMISDLAV